MKLASHVHPILAAAFLAVTVSTGFAATTNSVPRERLLLDFGWKFHLGNEWGLAQNLAKAGSGSGPASKSFSDASWRTVNLPHDWAVELPFDPSADAGHGFKPVGPGFAANNVAWYRRTFELPGEDAGKRLWLEFDGVFRDCEVFVNGWFVGHHESGYSSFRYDITDVANPGGKNVVAVKVDASQFEGWFYEGAGIYRHVWLVKTAPLSPSRRMGFLFTASSRTTCPAKNLKFIYRRDYWTSVRTSWKRQRKRRCAAVHGQLSQKRRKSKCGLNMKC